MILTDWPLTQASYRSSMFDHGKPNSQISWAVSKKLCPTSLQNKTKTLRPSGPQYGILDKMPLQYEIGHSHGQDSNHWYVRACCSSCVDAKNDPTIIFKSICARMSNRCQTILKFWRHSNSWTIVHLVPKCLSQSTGCSFSCVLHSWLFTNTDGSDKTSM